MQLHTKIVYSLSCDTVALTVISSDTNSKDVYLFAD